MPLTETRGRKFLLLLSSISMGASILLLTVALVLKQLHPDMDGVYNYCALAFLLCFSLAHAIG